MLGDPSWSGPGPPWWNFARAPWATVEALAGRVKGPTVEELDKIISKTLRPVGSFEDLADEAVSSDTSSDVSAPSQPSGQVALGPTPDPKVSVEALTSAQREEWRGHIMRGHVPYRKDCKFCVEGAGLGIQHRRIKNPQAYSLSVDLFGPMSGLERGRDEQSVSENPHLKFGLVGAFRFPKSALLLPAVCPKPSDVQDVLGDGDASAPSHVVQDELAEYEPSIPDEADENDEPFPELLVQRHYDSKTSDLSGRQPFEKAVKLDSVNPEDESSPPEDKEEWLDDVELDAQLRDLTSGVELVSLRYMIGLKSKNGPEVAAGVPQEVLELI